MLAQLKEGWAYVSGFAPVRTILLLFAIVSLMGWPFTVLMPIFAGNILKGGPHTLGFLMGAVGIGALVSAISLALRKTVLGLGKNDSDLDCLARRGPDPVWACRGFCGCRCLLMLVCGFGMMQQMAASNTIIQTIVEDEQTRPGDELLRHGFRRHGSFWEPAGRRAGSRHRRARHGDVERSVLRRGRGMVCDPTALRSEIDSTIYIDLGILPARRRGHSGQRRRVKKPPDPPQSPLSLLNLGLHHSGN